MRDALIISLVFHVAVMLSGVIGLPILGRDRPGKMTVIPVEMVKIGEVTKLTARQKKPDPARKKKISSRKKIPERRVEMPPEPPRLVSNMPLPDMKAKPRVSKKPADRKVNRTTARRAPKITPGNKPRHFNAGKLAALLDKREQSEPDIIEKLKDKEFSSENVVSAVDTAQQSLAIADAVNKHVYDHNCWNIPAGAKQAEGLRVTVHIRLDPGGKLIGSPKVTESKRMDLPGEEFFRTAAESALRAVLKCAPYDFLPRDQYDLWRDMEIIFDPEYMLNG